MKSMIRIAAFGFVCGFWSLSTVAAVDRLTGFDVMINGIKYVFDEAKCQFDPKKPEVFRESVSYQLFNPHKLTFLRSGKEIKLTYRLKNAVFAKPLNHTSVRHTTHDYTNYSPKTVDIELIGGGKKGDTHAEFRVMSATKIAEVAIIYSSDRFTLDFTAETKPVADITAASTYPTMTASVLGKKNHEDLTVSIGPRAKCQNDIPEDALGYEREAEAQRALPEAMMPLAPQEAPAEPKKPAPKAGKPAAKKPHHAPKHPKRSANSDEEPQMPGLNKEQQERVREAQKRLRELFERMRQRREQQGLSFDD